MSEVKVNKISPRTACGTVTLGDSGDTFTIPSGVTISNSGTASGFGSTGEVSWNTTKITADPANAVSGIGYFCDTTGGAFDVTLPTSPSAGNVVGIADYNGNFATNNLTVARNGSNINGDASNFELNKNNTSAQFLYVDGTEGWRIVFTGSLTGNGLQENFIVATGGTPCSGAISGNDKIHTFTGPGTLCVSAVADCASNNVVSYMVVAGGGGGGTVRAAGGGAGGFREYESPVTPYTSSPLDGNPGGTEITVTATGYPISVGAAGAAAPFVAPDTRGNATAGGPSIFSTITSTGGGRGATDNTPGAYPAPEGGQPGGSGGGSVCAQPVGTGNTPPVSPPQGTAGSPGTNSPNYGAGAGGGATQTGQAASTPTGGTGGAGATTCISASPIAYAGGGGGSGYGTFTPGPGGAGGGGNGAGPSADATAGTTNRGGGGGGGWYPSGGLDVPKIQGAAGGSGIVIIRYKYK